MTIHASSSLPGVLNTTTSGSQFLLPSGNSVFQLANGKFLVAYNKLGADYWFKVVDENASTIVSETKITTPSVSKPMDVAYAELSNGNIVAVFNDNRSATSSETSVEAQLFSSAGQPIGSRFLISDFGQQANMPDVTALDNGGFAVTYRSGSTSDTYDSGTDLHVKVYDSAGQPTGVDVSFARSLHTNPIIKQVNANVVAIISDFGSSDVFMQYMIVSTGQLALNQTLSQGNASRLLHTIDTGNGFLVVYTEDAFSGATYDTVKMRSVSNTGTVGPVLSLDLRSATTDGNVGSILTESVHVAVLADGSYLVTWHEDDPGETGTLTDVYALRFDAQGNRVGELVNVNDQAGNSFSNASTIDLGEDGFRVIYNDAFNTDGSGSGVLFSNFAYQSVESTSSDDVIRLYGYDATVNGGDGNDTIASSNSLLGTKTLEGGAGNDVLISGDGADNLDGGSGLDIASYANASSGVTVNLIAGTASDGDTLTAIERLVGSDFNDTLTGNNTTNDIVEGGAGNDSVRGSGGDDVVMGGDGNDLLFLDAGKDVLIGGAGSDTLMLVPSASSVIVRLDLGRGYLGLADGDTYSGIENVAGSRFRDIIVGDSRSNVLDGRNGNDLLKGEGGSDTLIGGNGDDTLDGGTGFDSLDGGAGADTFVFARGYRVDRVEDFEDGVDQLDLSAFNLSGFSDVLSKTSQNGTDLQIDFGGGDVLRISNFDLADFDAADVIL